MAPANNAAKALQQSRTRPVVPRPVVPAIPLSYGQKRQRHQAAQSKVMTVEVQTGAAVSEETSVDTKLEKDIISEVNDAANLSVDKKEDDLPAESAKQSNDEAVVVDLDVSSTLHVQELTTDTPEAGTPPTASDTPSASSKSTYQMPPPFIPGKHAAEHSPTPSLRHQVHNSVTLESPNFPPPQAFNGQHPLYHAHPSTSSLVFGGYPDSNNSSPAPPLSAGHFPPPLFPQNSHHHHPSIHHAPHLSNGGFVNTSPNGYSPMAPPLGYYPNVTGLADFSRQAQIPYGPADGYSPAHTPYPGEVRAYDPPTPHSFHGSQSSAQAAENEPSPAGFNQYAVANGSNGHPDEGRAYPPPRAKRPGSQAPLSFPAHPNGHLPHPTDHLDGLVLYLQSQFHNPALSDCSIELRYTDDRERPHIIPGHRLLLARSPTLKNIMAKHPQGGEYGQTLLIEAESPFLRTDGFAMAVQRLYGWPLIDHTVLSAINPRPGGQMPEMNAPGSPEDRFGLGLGYAVAGHILQIPPVVNRGLEIASAFINWNTIEKALEFHLDASHDSHGQNGHNDAVSIPGAVLDLLHQPATTFLITQFPASFRLDTTVETSTVKPRLPAIQEERPINHSHRLSFIKFGEYAGEVSDPLTSALSKILINLPFPTLKYVLESSRLGHSQGWATATARQDVMYAVIEEREKRRLKVYSSKIPDEQRLKRSAEWDAVGWQESVQPLAVNESRPTLGRTWVGFTLAPSS